MPLTPNYERCVDLQNQEVARGGFDRNDPKAVRKVHCAGLWRRYPSGRMESLRNAVAGLLATLTIACGFCTIALAQTPAHTPADDAALSLAICPIVYPLDQSPSERGYHYTFYGNGFFINKDGYLLTAAHVLSQLSDAQPYIVMRLPMAPPRLLKAMLVAVDRDHDVALLRATPNPFEGKYQVRFLPLAVDRPAREQAVLAAALRPSRLKDPHTFDAFVEDRPTGQVLAYEFSQLDKGSEDTELLLFSHDVLLGDSGAPVVSADSQTVVGLVEGRWLRLNAAAMAAATKRASSGVAAAVPIHYAIALLQQQGVAWHRLKEDASSKAPSP
ncbi:MAG: serine protease [Candidatus Acidiferrum sp.]